MKEYLFLFRGGDGEMSPEQMQVHMGKWMTWMQGLSEQKIMVAGLPLERDGKVVENGGDIITDGPFAEGKEVVGGYLIVKASSLDGATEISKGCPIFERGGSVEVRQILPLPT